MYNSILPVQYFKAIASTCPNHHEEVYLVGWEGEPQPISLSTGTSRSTVPGLRAGCSSNHQYRSISSSFNSS
ncbi:hypothetical protein C2G38_2256974 [Gigaspora rosea]|uniref:Uncharacterized protein n=1 Tax=Gigaspora rosea TaxID=44941 RepID=A0A397TPU1_9GLOM|nr:hypothetical protein C2G38_2256974 [Gigaspora rosea]